MSLQGHQHLPTVSPAPCHAPPASPAPRSPRDTHRPLGGVPNHVVLHSSQADSSILRGCPQGRPPSLPRLEVSGPGSRSGHGRVVAERAVVKRPLAAQPPPPPPPPLLPPALPSPDILARGARPMEHPAALAEAAADRATGALGAGGDTSRVSRRAAAFLERMPVTGSQLDQQARALRIVVFGDVLRALKDPANPANPFRQTPRKTTALNPAVRYFDQQAVPGARFVAATSASRSPATPAAPSALSPQTATLTAPKPIPKTDLTEALPSSESHARPQAGPAVPVTDSAQSVKPSTRAPSPSDKTIAPNNQTDQSASEVSRLRDELALYKARLRDAEEAALPETQVENGRENGISEPVPMQTDGEPAATVTAKPIDKPANSPDLIAAYNTQIKDLKERLAASDGHWKNAMAVQKLQTGQKMTSIELSHDKIIRSLTEEALRAKVAAEEAVQESALLRGEMEELQQTLAQLSEKSAPQEVKRKSEKAGPDPELVKRHETLLAELEARHRIEMETIKSSLESLRKDHAAANETNQQLIKQKSQVALTFDDNERKHEDERSKQETLHAAQIADINQESASLKQIIQEAAAARSVLERKIHAMEAKHVTDLAAAREETNRSNIEKSKMAALMVVNERRQAIIDHAETNWKTGESVRQNLLRESLQKENQDALYQAGKDFEKKLQFEKRKTSQVRQQLDAELKAVRASLEEQKLQTKCSSARQQELQEEAEKAKKEVADCSRTLEEEKAKSRKLSARKLDMQLELEKATVEIARRGAALELEKEKTNKANSASEKIQQLELEKAKLGRFSGPGSEVSELKKTLESRLEEYRKAEDERREKFARVRAKIESERDGQQKERVKLEKEKGRLEDERKVLDEERSAFDALRRSQPNQSAPPTRLGSDERDTAPPPTRKAQNSDLLRQKTEEEVARRYLKMEPRGRDVPKHRTSPKAVIRDLKRIPKHSSARKSLDNLLDDDLEVTLVPTSSPFANNGDSASTNPARNKKFAARRASEPGIRNPRTNIERTVLEPQTIEPSTGDERRPVAGLAVKRTADITSNVLPKSTEVKERSSQDGVTVAKNYPFQRSEVKAPENEKRRVTTTSAPVATRVSSVQRLNQIAGVGDRGSIANPASVNENARTMQSDPSARFSTIKRSGQANNVQKPDTERLSTAPDVVFEGVIARRLSEASGAEKGPTKVAQRKHLSSSMMRQNVTPRPIITPTAGNRASVPANAPAAISAAKRKTPNNGTGSVQHVDRLQEKNAVGSSKQAVKRARTEASNSTLGWGVGPLTSRSVPSVRKSQKKRPTLGDIRTTVREIVSTVPSNAGSDLEDDVRVRGHLEQLKQANDLDPEWLGWMLKEAKNHCRDGLEKTLKEYQRNTQA